MVSTRVDSECWIPPSGVDDLYKATSGNKFAGINRPTAGARGEKVLPVGTAPVQLYSLATPNGQKVSILFEELEELGCPFSYDAHFVNIGEGEQFLSGFVDINPNSKIPACIDQEGPSGKAVKLFESGSICLYFAEKYGKFIPENLAARAAMMNWLFWQMGSQGPMTGQFGHFFVYAPAEQKQARDYGVARYGMEAQRLCDVLNRQLSDRQFLLGDDYSLADIMIFPWFRQLSHGYRHGSGLFAKEFLGVEKYENALRWSERVEARPAVGRGLRVCNFRESEKGSKPWL